MKKLLAILALVVLIGSNFFGHSLMNALADETEQIEMVKYYTSVQIERGDSLWSIAGKYIENSGMTTADYVKELKNMNGLREDIIHSGQYLTVMYFVPAE
jgi:cell division protein YceG involved in septum cleavage